MSFFSKPCFTPWTMFAVRARSVPLIALACCESFAAAKTIVLESTLTVTSGEIACFSVPSGPFTVRTSLAKVTSTFSGSGMGFLPIRDMAAPLDHDAEDFAAHARVTGAAVGHHAAGSGDDGHAESVHHGFDVLAALVDAKAGAGNPLDLLDHGLAGVVLEADLEGVLALVGANREVLDVAFGLQHLGDCKLYLRAGHRDPDLFVGLGQIG